jgi:methionyl-tRNA formyltransferase
MICNKSSSNWHSGSGEEVENVKVYRQKDGQTDNGRSEKYKKKKIETESKISFIMAELYALNKEKEKHRKSWHQVDVIFRYGQFFDEVH